MKKYYFSTNKHAHDIEFRFARLTNLRARLESENKPIPEWLERTIERLDEIRDYMVGACGRPIQLTGELYALAMDTVGWASINRR